MFCMSTLKVGVSTSGPLCNLRIKIVGCCLWLAFTFCFSAYRKTKKMLEEHGLSEEVSTS